MSENILGEKDARVGIKSYASEIMETERPVDIGLYKYDFSPICNFIGNPAESLNVANAIRCIESSLKVDASWESVADGSHVIFSGQITPEAIENAFSGICKEIVAEGIKC